VEVAVSGNSPKSGDIGYVWQRRLQAKK